MSGLEEITVTLQCSRQTEPDDKICIYLHHPDLIGELKFYVSSDRLAEIFLRELDANKKNTSVNPIQDILDNAGKLMSNIGGLKESFKKK